MFARRTYPWIGRTLFEVLVIGMAAAQSVNSTSPSREGPPTSPTQGPAGFDLLVDSAIRQEHRLILLMRNFTPIVETYIQEEKTDSELGTTPRSDDYFLSRLNLKGNTILTRSFEE